MAKCNHDCFNCKFDDCINDSLTTTEIIECNQRDISLKEYGYVLQGKHRKSKLKGNRHLN